MSLKKNMTELNFFFKKIFFGHNNSVRNFVSNKLWLHFYTVSADKNYYFLLGQFENCKDQCIGIVFQFLFLLFSSHLI